MSDWKALMAAWDSLVEETGKGIKANLSYGSVQTALRVLVAESATPQQVMERGKHMILVETWRRPGYLTLSALQSSWESLGEEVGRKKAREAHLARIASEAERGVLERRRRLEEPVMDKSPIREWLERHGAYPD